MKNLFLFPILLSMVLLAGCQTTSDNASDGGATSTAAKGTLVIEYDETGTMSRPGGYNTINNEQDRFYYLEENFETVFQEKLSDYDLDFQLYPANASENANVLEISFLSLDSPSPIELELRLWVILKQGDKETDLGVTRSRIVPQRPMTQGSIERDLNSIYTDAAKKVLEKISAEL